MSTTTACFPVTGSYLAAALKMQVEYADLLDGWRAWLERGSRPTHAEAVLLWRLIDLTRARRGKDGVWADVSEKVLPSSDQMNKVIDQEKFNKFRDEMLPMRQQIEAVATELVLLLETPELRTELNAYPDELRWGYAAQLGDGLAESGVGMLYLHKTVVEPVPDDRRLLPALHTQQLTGGSLARTTFTVDTPPVRRAARAYVTLLTKVLPAVLASDLDKFTEVSVDFILRSVAVDEIASAATLKDKLEIADRLILQDVDAWIEANKPWWAQTSMVRVSTGIAGMFDVLNVGLAVAKFWDKPSPVTTAAVMRAVSSLIASASTVNEMFGLKFVVLSKSAKSYLTRFNAVYDVAMASIATYETWKAVHTGDYSVAAGQAMQAVGLAATAGISTYATLVGVAAVIPGLQVLALVGFLLILGGTLLVEYTKDSRYEMWLGNSWFGINWSSVDVEESPETPMYRAKVRDANGQDFPDIARQVSTWISIFYPIDLKVTHDATYVYVTCSPTLAAPEAAVSLRRIEDEGLVLPGPFKDYLVYNRALNDTSDANIVPTLTGTPPLQQVTGWRARLDHGPWWPTFDLHTHYFEVAMTPAGALTSQIIHDIEAGNAVPFLIQGRTKVE